MYPVRAVQSYFNIHDPQNPLGRKINVHLRSASVKPATASVKIQPQMKNGNETSSLVNDLKQVEESIEHFKESPGTHNQIEQAAHPSDGIGQFAISLQKLSGEFEKGTRPSDEIVQEAPASSEESVDHSASSEQIGKEAEIVNSSTEKSNDLSKSVAGVPVKTSPQIDDNGNEIGLHNNDSIGLVDKDFEEVKKCIDQIEEFPSGLGYDQIMVISNEIEQVAHFSDEFTQVVQPSKEMEKVTPLNDKVVQDTRISTSSKSLAYHSSSIKEIEKDSQISAGFDYSTSIEQSVDHLNKKNQELALEVSSKNHNDTSQGSNADLANLNNANFFQLVSSRKRKSEENIGCVYLAQLKESLSDQDSNHMKQTAHPTDGILQVTRPSKEMQKGTRPGDKTELTTQIPASSTQIKKVARISAEIVNSSTEKSNDVSKGVAGAPMKIAKDATIKIEPEMEKWTRPSDEIIIDHSASIKQTEKEIQISAEIIHLSSIKEPDNSNKENQQLALKDLCKPHNDTSRCLNVELSQPNGNQLILQRKRKEKENIENMKQDAELSKEIQNMAPALVTTELRNSQGVNIDLVNAHKLSKEQFKDSPEAHDYDQIEQALLKQARHPSDEIGKVDERSMEMEKGTRPGDKIELTTRILAQSKESVDHFTSCKQIGKEAQISAEIVNSSTEKSNDLITKNVAGAPVKIEPQMDDNGNEIGLQNNNNAEDNHAHKLSNTLVKDLEQVEKCEQFKESPGGHGYDRIKQVTHPSNGIGKSAQPSKEMEKLTHPSDKIELIKISASSKESVDHSASSKQIGKGARISVEIDNDNSSSIKKSYYHSKENQQLALKDSCERYSKISQDLSVESNIANDNQLILLRNRKVEENVKQDVEPKEIQYMAPALVTTDLNNNSQGLNIDLVNPANASSSRKRRSQENDENLKQAKLRKLAHLVQRKRTEYHKALEEFNYVFTGTRAGQSEASV